MTIRKRAEFLPFGKPFFEEAEILAVAEAVRSGWISTGPRTQEFQRLMREYTGCPFALGLSSCTAGLYLALRLLEIGPGDEVLVPAMTFAATANVVEHCGATPIFVDVDPDTILMRPDLAAAAITPRTRAVIPVHLYGRAADMAAFRRLCGKHKLALVGDCAHAIETRVEGAHVAGLADLSAFSFYATKNLAVGEGGMLVTADEKLFARAETLCLHGMSRGAFKRFSASAFQLYDVIEAGYKMNMTDISAALGIEQFKRLEPRLKRREEIWRRYDEAFADLPLILPAPVPPNQVHARHLYTLRVTGGLAREQMLQGIQAANLGVAVHYTALPLFSFYREKYGFRRGRFPAAEAVSDSTFSIPMTPYLSDEDVDLIIAAVRETALGRS